MKAIILARVSTEEQKEAGNSIPSQQFRLRKYCNGANLDIVKEFTFDESAYSKKRVRFDQIIKILEKSKDKVALCCDKIDRLLRNFTKDLVALEEMRRDGRLELHFPSDNIVLTKDSPAPDLFRFTMGVSLAKYYSDSISDNVKRSQEQKIRNGEWPGKAPYGYLNVQNGDDTDIIIDPETDWLVKKAFELRAQDKYSLDQIVKKLSKDSWEGNKSKLDHILKNPFYYGQMRWKEELYPHKYKSLILRALFDQVQDINESWVKRPIKYASLPFAYRGVIECADCGCTVTPEKKKNKYIYYHCTKYKGDCGGEWVRSKDLTVQFQELLMDIKIPDKDLEEIKNDLRKIHNSESEFHKTAMTNLKREYDKIENRLDKMYEDKLDGRITSDDYDRRLKKYKLKQQDYILQMEEHSKADENYLITANKVLDLASKAPELFKSSKPKEKKTVTEFRTSELHFIG